MSKKLDTASIASELSEGSAFFRRTPVSQPKDKQVTSLPEKVSPPDTQPTGRPPDEPATRPSGRETGKRVLVRRGFEWYEDQLAALKRLSLREQMEGKPGSMSQMVREALDAYLQKRASKK